MLGLPIFISPLNLAISRTLAPDNLPCSRDARGENAGRIFDSNLCFRIIVAVSINLFLDITILQVSLCRPPRFARPVANGTRLDHHDPNALPNRRKRPSIVCQRCFFVCCCGTRSFPIPAIRGKGRSTTDGLGLHQAG